MSANSYTIMAFQCLWKHILQSFKNILIWFSAFSPYRIKEFCTQEPWKSNYSLASQIIFSFRFSCCMYSPLKFKGTWKASFSLDLNL